MDAHGQPGGGPSTGGPGGAPTGGGGAPSGAPGGGPGGPGSGPGEGPGFVERMLEAKATMAFVLATCGIFYFCINDPKVGGNISAGIGDEVAERFGGYTYPAVRDRGEWWRFFSTLFVSRHALYAFLYVYLFLSMAPQVERVLGTVRFTIMYFVAGAGAIALNEVFGDRVRAMFGGDVMVAVYAVFGAVPGLVLGLTGSMNQTLKHPSSSGAFFYAAFLTIATWLQTKKIDPAPIFSMVMAFIMTAGLVAQRRGSRAGYAGISAGILIAALAITCVSKGLSWQQGKLQDRGVGVTTVRPGTKQPPGGDPQEAPPTQLGSQQAASEAAQEVQKTVRPFLDQFGPLPIDEGIKISDRQKAEELLVEVRKVVNGPNLVVGELDEEQVLLLLLSSNMHEALRVANQHVDLVAPERGFVVARARALRGVVRGWLGGGQLDRAYDDLDAAAATSGFTEQMPEVLFHYALVIKNHMNDDEAARAQFQRYVRLVGEGEQPEWRRRMMKIAREHAGM